MAPRDLVPVSRAYAEGSTSASLLHDARMQFFPGGRNQRRVLTKVGTDELRQEMSRVGVKAQSILASLAFRAWALAVAEAKRQVAELACSAGVPLLRRAKHALVVKRLVDQRVDAQVQSMKLRCLLSWHVAACSPGDGGGERRYRARRLRASLIRDGRLLGQVIGMWRIACSGQAGTLSAARGLWAVEPERALRRLLAKLDACHHGLDLAFGASSRRWLLQRIWQTWARKMRGRRKAQEMYLACTKRARDVLPALCLKLWAAAAAEWRGERRCRARRSAVAGSILQRAVASFDVGAVMLAFNAWRKLRRAAWRKANGLPVKRYGHAACFRAWRQKTRRMRDAGILVPKEVVPPAERHHSHGLCFIAWRRRVRHRRNVGGVFLAEAAASDRALQRLVLAAWSARLRHRQGRRRGISAADRVAVKLLAHQGRALLAVALHGWWLTNLLRRTGSQERFHLGLQRLQRWRSYSERAATGSALAAALTLGAGEALTEAQRKHFLAVRAFQEWCRTLAESRESALARGKIELRKQLLQRVATVWAEDDASALLRSTWDFWCSAQHFSGRLKKLGAARRALLDGLVSCQGDKTSNLFLQHLMQLWRGICLESCEERRRMERRQLAASVLGGRSRLGEQVLRSQVLLAWSAEAREGRAVAWARRSARQGQAKAALAARIALGEESTGMALLLHGWLRAAGTQRRRRGRTATREALSMSLGRWELRGLMERWTESAKQSKTERWLHEQRMAEKQQDLRRRVAAVRRLLSAGAGTFCALVLQSWQTAVRMWRQERRQHLASTALAAGLDESGRQRLVVSSWQKLALETRQARLSQKSRRDGSGSLCKGLLNLLQSSHEEATEPLLMRMVWQSWLSSATSGQAMSQALHHDSQHQSAQEELSQVLGTLMSQQEDLQRTRKRLAGASRTVAISLCHGLADTARLALLAWRRRAQRAGEGEARALAREQEFSGSLLHLVLARWHQVTQRQKHRKQVCTKAALMLVQDEASFRQAMLVSWRLLTKEALAAAAVSARRRTSRDARCAALRRFVWEFDSALLLSAVAAWTRSTKASGLRKRFVKGSSNFCETVDGLCQAARLQALFTAWVDVLVISQTAAMRLGIRRPQEALSGLWGAQGVTKRRQVLDEQQLQEQLNEAARAQARLAPIRLQHLTTQAVFSQWSGLLAQLHQARSLAALVEQRMARGILRGTFGGWRDVHSRNPSAVIRAKQHNWTTRRSRCLCRVLTAAVDRDGQAMDRLTWSTAFALWAAEAKRVRGERVGSAEKLADTLAVTVMLWRQDQFHGLVSRTMTAWRTAVLELGAERLQETSEVRRRALVEGAEALTRDTPGMLAATIVLRALLAWRQLAQAGDVRKNRRKAHIAAVLGTCGKKGDEVFLRICMHWWNVEAATASHTNALMHRRSNYFAVAEYVLNRDELFCLIEVWFVRWRWSYFGQRAQSLEGEVRMLADLLNESTLTCRELRTQLLTLRGASWRLGRATLWAMFVSWHRLISATPRTEGIPATASMPAVAAGLRGAARRLTSNIPAITR